MRFRLNFRPLKGKKVSELPRSELVYSWCKVENTYFQGAGGPVLVGGDTEGVKASGANLAAGQCQAWVVWCPCLEGCGKQPPGVQRGQGQETCAQGSQDAGSHSSAGQPQAWDSYCLDQEVYSDQLLGWNQSCKLVKGLCFVCEAGRHAIRVNKLKQKHRNQEKTSFHLQSPSSFLY